MRIYKQRNKMIYYSCNLFEAGSVINWHHSTGHTGTNVISANELVDAEHHNDSISSTMSSGFHGNTKFRNVNITLVHAIFLDVDVIQKFTFSFFFF